MEDCNRTHVYRNMYSRKVKKKPYLTPKVKLETLVAPNHYFLSEYSLIYIFKLFYYETVYISNQWRVLGVFKGYFKKNLSYTF